MPKVKTLFGLEPLTRLLKAYDVNTSCVAEICKCSLPTARKKIRNIEYMTVGEFQKIVKIQGIPTEEVLEAISKC